MSLPLDLAIRKIHRNRFRSFILGAPVALLVAVVAVLFSWLANFHDKVEVELVKTNQIEQQTIKVASGGSAFGNNSGLKHVFTYNGISDKNLKWLQQIDGVEGISPIYNPEINGRLQISGILYDTGPIKTLNAELAALYEASDFAYTPDKPIPVILGARSMNQTSLKLKPGQEVSAPINQGVEEWQAKFLNRRTGREVLTSQLVNQQASFIVNLMPPKPSMSTSTEGGKRTVRALTSQDVEQYQKAQQKLLSPYWNIEQASQPIVFNFQIVGINFDNSGYSISDTYIPQDAAIYMLNQIYQRQLTARTSQPLPASQLQEEIIGSIMQREKFHPTAGYNSHLQSIESAQLTAPAKVYMPSLLLRAMRNIHGQLTMTEVVDHTFTKQNLHIIEAVLKAPGTTNRQAIFEQIGHDRGMYAITTEQDSISLFVANLSKAMIIIAAIVGSLAGIAVLVFCWSFAADSGHEVGLLRVLGVSDRAARIIILLQVGSIFIIASFVGLLIGWLVVQATASWSADFLNNEVLTRAFGESSNQDSIFKLSATEMSKFRLDCALPYTALALILPVLATFIALHRRLKTNPLRALKNL